MQHVPRTMRLHLHVASALFLRSTSEDSPGIRTILVAALAGTLQFTSAGARHFGARTVSSRTAAKVSEVVIVKPRHSPRSPFVRAPGRYDTGQRVALGVRTARTTSTCSAPSLHAIHIVPWSATVRPRVPRRSSSAGAPLTSGSEVAHRSLSYLISSLFPIWVLCPDDTSDFPPFFPLVF